MKICAGSPSTYQLAVKLQRRQLALRLEKVLRVAALQHREQVLQREGVRGRGLSEAHGEGSRDGPIADDVRSDGTQIGAALDPRDGDLAAEIESGGLATGIGLVQGEGKRGLVERRHRIEGSVDQEAVARGSFGDEAARGRGGLRDFLRIGSHREKRSPQGALVQFAGVDSPFEQTCRRAVEGRQGHDGGDGVIGRVKGDRGPCDDELAAVQRDDRPDVGSGDQARGFVELVNGLGQLGGIRRIDLQIRHGRQ
jgi:hypothetical protein